MSGGVSGGKGSTERARALVRQQLARIFGYRRQAVERIFSGESANEADRRAR